MKRFRTLILGLALALFAPALAYAQAGDYDHDAPDIDWVWEDGYELDGRTYDGFYRPRSRDGYTWRGAYWEDEVYVPGGWLPVSTRSGYTWERGYRGADGFWVPGHYRRTYRKNYEWVPGERVDGLWQPGYWRPIRRHAGYVWVSGYFDADGYWVDGFWRPTHRTQYTWIVHRVRYGYTIPGYWMPSAVRVGYAWIPGYATRYGWVSGKWRRAYNRNHYWRRGRRVRGVWVAGSWVSGRRPRVVRRYVLVKRVRTMNRVRRTYRRSIRRVMSRRGALRRRSDTPNDA